MGLFTVDNTAAAEECVAILQDHAKRCRGLPVDAATECTMRQLIIAMEPFDVKRSTRDNFQKMLWALLSSGDTERAIEAINSIGGVSLRNWVPHVARTIIRVGQFTMYVGLLGLAIMILRWVGLL